MTEKPTTPTRNDTTGSASLCGDTPMSRNCGLRRLVPWWMNIAAHLALRWLPIGDALYTRIGLFRHGRMDASYAFSTFHRHYDRCRAAGLVDGFTMPELGPGESVASALLGAAYGASRSYLVDVGRYVKTDMRVYRGIAGFPAHRGLPIPHAAALRSFDEMLVACRAQYLTDGLTSLRAIPDHTVDLIYSQAVLEHVPERELPATMRECRRILTQHGVSSHRVDLKDHLSGRLDSLRLPAMQWQRLATAAGVYTNRIRFADMMHIFEDAGFRVQVVSIDRWLSLPTPRDHLAIPFRLLAEDDLRVSGFDVVLRPL